MEYYTPSEQDQTLTGADFSQMNLPDNRTLWKSSPDWRLRLQWLCYNWVSPINLALALIIIVHNSIIVRYYYLHRTDITHLLFLLIGIADIFAATGMTVFSVSSALFYNNLIDQIPFQRGIIFFLLLFPAALSCSRSLNVFVTMIKTINVASISRRGVPNTISSTAVVVASFITFLLWLILNTSDVSLGWTFYVGQPLHYRGKGVLLILLTSSIVGRETSGYLIFGLIYLDSSLTPGIVINTILIAIHFVLPSLITFVCMVIQIHSIKSSLLEPSNSNEPSATYINTTTCMITGLFCFCHTAFSVYIAVTFFTMPGTEYLWRRPLSETRSYLALVSLLEFTLPLFNAALFPLIIILRNQYLRRKYRACFVWAWLTIRGGVGVVIRRCAGVITCVG